MFNLNSVAISFGFLMANVLVMWLILVLNRRPGSEPPSPPPPESSTLVKPLYSGDILKLEFEYARFTASEAMGDRHTMVNFYLLAFGVIATGVLAILSRERPTCHNRSAHCSCGSYARWAGCTFLKITRLRQAWHDSARAMNQIKEFFIQHDDHFDPEELRTAFRWQASHPATPG